MRIPFDEAFLLFTRQRVTLGTSAASEPGAEQLHKSCDLRRMSAPVHVFGPPGGTQFLGSTDRVRFLKSLVSSARNPKRMEALVGSNSATLHYYQSHCCWLLENLRVVLGGRN